MAERHQIVRAVRASVLALDDVVDFQLCVRTTFMIAMLALEPVTPPDILLDVVESILRPLLVPDAFDIRILDPVYVELGFLNHYT